MRWALCFFAVSLGGCLDISVEPGTLRCDPAAASPCPEAWACLAPAMADGLGRCFPGGKLPAEDLLAVGPAAAPTVRNNLANKVNVPKGAIAGHNALVVEPDVYFVDWKAQDFRLREGSSAVDRGTQQGAPAVDLAGRSRDATPDQGAYELVRPQGG